MENQQSIRSEVSVPSSSILKEVLAGLSQPQKMIPPKFLYDRKGSEIFLEICQLDEYYPTRTETQILTDFAREMARAIGPGAILIEPGSGSGDKVRLLLPHLQRVKAYVPVEISRDILMLMTEEFHHEFPKLRVIPVCGDFTANLELPHFLDNHPGKKVVFFPGSTIGNFRPDEAVDFLKHYAKIVGTGGGFLIGADLKKDSIALVRAYDDSQGVTANFNLNLLECLNREASANFVKENFDHKAIYNEDLGRVEMHLVSKIPQLVRVNQTVFRLRAGESIHTESSYKYSVEEFTELCSKAKLQLKQYWQDEDQLFCVYYFERE